MSSAVTEFDRHFQGVQEIEDFVKFSTNFCKCQASGSTSAPARRGRSAGNGQILDVTRTRRKKQKRRQRYKFVQINESVCLFEGKRSAAGDSSSFYLIVMNNIYKNMEIN